MSKLDEHPNKVITRAELKAAISGMMQVVGQHLRETNLKVAALERDAQTWKDFGYCGVFEEGRRYVPNNLSTFQGSLWIANVATSARPGTSAAWTLICKKGRDGKDGADGRHGKDAQQTPWAERYRR